MKEEWTYKKLGEVCFYPKDRIALSEISANQYVGVETLVKDRGGVSFGDNLPNVDSAIEFIKEDVLIGNIRPYLKKIWMSDRRGGASGDIIVIRVSSNNKDSISPHYLFKVLSSNKFFEYDNAHTHGAKMPRGDRISIAEYIIPIPPLSEQQRIVSELDLLSSIIEKKKAQLKEYDQLSQSIFYDMFGDPVTNEKGWEVKKLGEIGTFQRGGALQRKDFVENGFPCIHYGQLHTSFGAFTKKHITCISEDLYLHSRIAHKNDLILALTSEDVEGSCKSTAWLGDYDIAIGSDAAIFSHNQNAIYLSFYTRTKAFYHEKEKYAHGFKVTHIKTSEIAIIPVPLPPLTLQQSFASKIEAIERQKALIQQSIIETETLFNSRMDYYFN